MLDYLTGKSGGLGLYKRGYGYLEDRSMSFVCLVCSLNLDCRQVYIIDLDYWVGYYAPANVLLAKYHG
jgi:hypothetical protein